MKIRLLLAVALAGLALGYFAGRLGGPDAAPPGAPPPRPAAPPPPPAPHPAARGPTEDAAAPAEAGPSGDPAADSTPPGEEDPAALVIKHIDRIVREPAAPPDPIPDLYVGSLVHTPNGDLKIVGSGADYRLVRHGTWITRFEGGEKATEEEYVEGVLEGPATTWHENGAVKERGAHRAGKRDGRWQAFDPEGNRTAETEYEAGKIVSVRRWDAAGNLETDEVLEARATCGGKYRDLLYRFHVPGDVGRYGEFRDYGHYRQTDYQGVKDVPAAYWVYVYPYWYVWREKAE